MFIQERYEVISKIGSGGMADVYKVKDHKLNRFVAVKVLKREFRADKAFISKFRIEAQSAAGLAHPNIVNVYDVGEEKGINFIVMELVEGITLKEYIEKKGRLAVREATSIAIQVCYGLQAAHNNGIVHRDVKPQNIIISTDGKVKVTDFGIARAASSNTISSNVMGSVHYSSPEQARGGYSDYKSDIYSLGITLYEMLTGHVPFDGDTTVAIALKHLQEEMQSPRKYVPDLPKSTVQIVYKCTQKSPDRRYADMEELIGDLKESLVNPEGDFVKIASVNPHAQTITVSRQELERIKEGRTEIQPPDDSYQNIHAGQIQENYGSGNPGYHAGGDTPEHRYGSSYQNYRANQGVYHNSEDEDEDEGGVSPKLEKFMTIGSIVVGALILCVFLALVGSAAGLFDLGFLAGKNKKEPVTEAAETSSEASGQVAVPGILGKTEEEARELLKEYGLGMNFAGEKASSEYEEGQIMEQEPAEGEMAEKNSTVSYTVSTGSDLVMIPELENKSVSDAEQELDALGLKSEQEYVYDESVDQGRVSDTSPGQGTEVERGTVVTLYISKGQSDTQESDEDSDEPIAVPDVTGQSSEAAQAVLESLGLVVQIETEEDPNEEDDVVIRQDIGQGEVVDKGTTVILTVNKLEDRDDTEDRETESKDTENTTEPATTYSTDIKLKQPKDYDGEPVRIEMVQDGRTTTFVDGEAVEFPYRLKMDSDSKSDGIAYVYVLDSEGNVTKKVEYEGVPFR